MTKTRFKFFLLIKLTNAFLISNPLLWVGRYIGPTVRLSVRESSLLRFVLCVENVGFSVFLRNCLHRSDLCFLLNTAPESFRFLRAIFLKDFQLWVRSMAIFLRSNVALCGLDRRWSSELFCFRQEVKDKGLFPRRRRSLRGCRFRGHRVACHLEVNHLPWKDEFSLRFWKFNEPFDVLSCFSF